MADTLIAEARALADRTVALRRAIHAEPELGLMTPKTRDKVRAALAHLPLDWREGPSTTGLVATLKGGKGSGRRPLPGYKEPNIWSCLMHLAHNFDESVRSLDRG